MMIVVFLIGISLITPLLAAAQDKSGFRDIPLIGNLSLKTVRER